MTCGAPTPATGGAVPRKTGATCPWISILPPCTVVGGNSFKTGGGDEISVVTAGAGATYSTIGAGAAYTAGAGAMYSTTGACAAYDTAGAGAMYSTTGACAAYIVGAANVEVATGTAAVANGTAVATGSVGSAANMVSLRYVLITPIV